MRNATDFYGPAALDEGAYGGSVTCSDTPRVILQRGPAGNDATCEDHPAISADEIERQAQHARAANGLGDVATFDTPASARPTRYVLQQAVRAQGAFIFNEIIVAAIRAAGAIARRAHARHRQRRQARAIYDGLRQLDDHMLRDLGFDRSEITSVAAELMGKAQYTRVRALADVAQSSERSSRVTSPETVNPTIYSQEQNEEVTMHRYQISTPRVVFAITAVAMTAIALGVLVVMPARMEAISHEPEALAAPKVIAPSSTSAVAGPAIDVVAVHEPGLPTVSRTPSKPIRKPEG